MIKLKEVTYTIDQRRIIDNMSFAFAPSTFYGLIGPNGTGKSTLIQLISGILQANKGEITLHDKPIAHYRKKQLAQQIAVLQQGGIEPLAYTVEEVLVMARYPYQHFLGYEKEDSQPIIDEAIRRTSIKHLLKQKLSELSGGERQRVALAKLWVQRPSILLLDEPTTYLDIGYQQMVMEFIASWQKEENLLVIAVMHDINLAALYCEQVIAMMDGQIIASGATTDVLTEPILNQLFAANIDIIEHPHLSVPQMIMNHIKL